MTEIFKMEEQLKDIKKLFDEFVSNNWMEPQLNKLRHITKNILKLLEKNLHDKIIYEVDKDFIKTIVEYGNVLKMFDENCREFTKPMIPLYSKINKIEEQIEILEQWEKKAVGERDDD